MSHFKSFVPALLLTLALPVGAGAQNKIFFSPTTSTTQIASCSSSYADLTLDIANEAATKVALGSVQTHVQAGAFSSETTTSTAAVAYANDNNFTGYVSLTINSGGGHGPETYRYTGSTTGLALATAVQAGLVAAYPLPDRGIKESSTYYVLKYTSMPAAVSFLLFSDCATAHATLPGSATEPAFVCTSSGRDAIGLGLGSGICSWLGVSCTGGGTCVPTTEICDGKDNDCDSTVDDGNPGGGVACSTGSPGLCGQGTTLCQGGAIVCQATTTTQPEICNGADDDCDGTVDDGNPGGGANCSTGQSGICSAGTRRCVGGTLVCQSNATATTEICDGKDNDCDGTADDNNPGGGQSCATGGQGECGRGTSYCQGGTIVCTQATESSPEICDGKDNDCDGQTDEGNPESGGDCGTGKLGLCGVGRKDCSTGNLVCVQVNQPAAESCDGKDNDCDGLTDEELPSVGEACGTGLPGTCAQGERRCVVGEMGCVQKVQATGEVCDGLDNDCNGVTDDAPGCEALPDAGGLPPPLDAGREPERDAGTREPAPEVPSSGCGCTAGADGTGLLALFALAGLRRRRR